MIRRQQSALAKDASILNKLWTGCKYVSCVAYDEEAYESVGSYEPANLVVTWSKRQRFLEYNAADVAKAMGQRDPSLADAQRRTLVERMVLKATTKTDLHKSMMLGSLFNLSFSLPARGATARGLKVSDLAFKRFPSMFGVGGDTIDVLCSYINATEMSEGFVYILGSIGHTEQWLCSLGSVADTMVCHCHRPGQDTLTPPCPSGPSLGPQTRSC